MQWVLYLLKSLNIYALLTVVKKENRRAMRIFFSIIIILFIGCFTEANGQSALVKLNSGDSIESYITSIDSLRLHTLDSSYLLSNLQEVVFHKQKGKNIHLYYELAEAGVKVRFDESKQFPQLDPLQVKVKRDPLSLLKENLNDYRKAQEIGAGLQLAGVVLGATGLFFDSDAIATVGLGIAVGGLIYEISSGRHLSHLEY